MGQLVVKLLKEDQHLKAMSWLNWMSKQGESSAKTTELKRAIDPLEGPLFSLFWQPSLGIAPQRMELAGWVLKATGGLDKAGFARVEKLGRSLPKEMKPKYNYAMSLLYGRSENYRKATEYARKVYKSLPLSPNARMVLYASLVDAGSYRQAERMAKKALASDASDTLAQEQLASLATAQGQFEKAENLLKGLLSRGNKSSLILNNLAWVSLLRGQVDSQSVRYAEQANALSQGQSADEMHTLAALYAEQGKSAEALELLKKRLDLRNAQEPENIDYYLIGRVMENLELYDLAKKAYLKVLPESGKRKDSTYHLTQRRLRSLPDSSI